MTNAEAIVNLESDNADLILMRVGGSVAIIHLDDALQGKLNWVERDEVMDVALKAAIEKSCI